MINPAQKQGIANDQEIVIKLNLFFSEFIIRRLNRRYKYIPECQPA